MENIVDFLAWFLFHTSEDFHTHPGLFWIKAMVAGTLWAFVVMGVVGGAYFLFSSDFDDWNKDR